jgi:uncharacterized membrane protein
MCRILSSATALCTQPVSLAATGSRLAKTAALLAALLIVPSIIAPSRAMAQGLGTANFEVIVTNRTSMALDIYYLWPNGRGATQLDMNPGSADGVSVGYVPQLTLDADGQPPKIRLMAKLGDNIIKDQQNLPPMTSSIGPGRGAIPTYSYYLDIP